MPRSVSTSNSAQSTASAAFAQSNNTTSLFLGGQQRPWMNAANLASESVRKTPAGPSNAGPVQANGMHAPVVAHQQPAPPVRPGQETESCLPRDDISPDTLPSQDIASTASVDQRTDASSTPAKTAAPRPTDGAVSTTTPQGEDCPDKSTSLANGREHPVSVQLTSSTPESRGLAQPGSRSVEPGTTGAAARQAQDTAVSSSTDEPTTTTTTPPAAAHEVAASTGAPPQSRKRPLDATEDGLQSGRARPPPGADADALTQLPTPHNSPMQNSAAGITRLLQHRKAAVVLAPHPSIDFPRFAMLHEACEFQDQFFLYLHQLYCIWSVGSPVVPQLRLTAMQIQGLKLLSTILSRNDALSRPVFSLFLTFPGPEMYLLSDEVAALREAVGAFLQSFAQKYPSLRGLVHARKYPITPVEFYCILCLPSLVLQRALFRSELRQQGSTEDWLDPAQRLFDAESKLFLQTYGDPKSVLMTEFQILSHVHAFGMKYFQLRAREAGQSSSGSPTAHASVLPTIEADVSGNQLRSGNSTALPASNRTAATSRHVLQHNHLRPSIVPALYNVDGHIVPVQVVTAAQHSATVGSATAGPTATSTDPHSPLTSVVTGPQYSHAARKVTNASTFNPSLPFPSQLLAATRDQPQPRLGPSALHLHSNTPASPSFQPSALHPAFPNLQIASTATGDRNRIPRSTVAHYPSSHSAISALRPAPQPGTMVIHQQSRGPQSRPTPTSPVVGVSHPHLLPDPQRQPQPGASRQQTQQQASQQAQQQRPLTIFPTNPGYQLPIQVPANPTARALHQPHLQAQTFVKISSSGSPTSARFYQVPESYFYLCSVDADSGVMSCSFNVSHELASCKVESTDQGSGAIPLNSCVIGNGSSLFRLKCVKLKLGETVNSASDAQIAVAPTTWPTCLAASLNGSYAVEFARKQHFGTDIATDITRLICEGANTMRLTVNYSQAEKRELPTYHFAVEVIRIFDHSSLLLQPVPMAKEESMKAIQAIFHMSSTDGDDEVMIADACVSIDITDPFTSQMWKVPVRGKLCRHREAFDLDAYLQSRTVRGGKADGVAHPDQWRCPICRQDARPNQLAIDGFLQTVRQELEAKKHECRAILVKEDGTWEAKMEERTGEASKSTSPEVRDEQRQATMLRNDSETTREPGTGESTARSEMAAASVRPMEVIVLDDD